MQHKRSKLLAPPTFVDNATQTFYRNNRVTVKIDNELHQGFTATRGIRQGCPLSPLIYAIATDSLVRHLETQLPGATARAFADDAAVAIPSWEKTPQNFKHREALQQNNRNAH